MSRRLVFAFLGAWLCITLIIPQQPAYAASTTVSTETELKAAIDAANLSPEADTILLAADIFLTSPAETSNVEGDSGLDSITSDITIEGQGFAIVRDDNAPQFRIIRIGPGGVLTLVNVSILNGFITEVYPVGAGILNSGTLTVIHCTIAQNKVASPDPNAYGGMGGGIFNDNIGTMTIRDSFIFDNYSANIGAGIFSYSYITNTVNTITDTIVSGNHAGFSGGGIQNDTGSLLVISDSTFSYNTAKFYGAGVFNWETTLTILNTTIADNTLDSGDGQGAGIYNGNTTTLIVSNSTIDDNTGGLDTGQGGGVYNHAFGNFTSVNNSIFNNYAAVGGGVFGDTSDIGNSVATFTNTILARSTGGNCAGTGTITGSFSLAGELTCPGFTRSSSIGLGQIADNGGSTYSAALGVGSSALDTARNSDCIGNLVGGLDQRGVKRGVNGAGAINSPQAGDCDIGAFESGGIIRTLQFASSSATFAYPIAPTISAVLTLGSPLAAGYGPVKVYVCVSGGTAVAGSDYVPFGVKTVTFNPGDTTAVVTVDLLAQPVSSDKTIILAIADFNGPGFSGPARLGIHKTSTLTLKASSPSAAPSLNLFTTHTPTLSWNQVNEATGYEIEVDNDTAFNAPYAFHEDTLSSDTLSAAPTTPLTSGTYYWRVRAQKADGTPGAWSATQTFTIAP